MSKRSKPARTMIIKHEDGYHINYKRGDGYNAMIDAPYFSAICLGWFDSQTAAQSAIDTYRYDELTSDCVQVAA
jgi:hypothetical protein